MPTPNLPQGIVDPLNPGVQATECLSLTGYNTVGGIQGVGLPDARCDEKATAEWRNTINALLRSFCDYVQGLTPITALQIDTFFKMPRYTTAQLTNALAISQGEGAQAYDTTTNRLKSSNGTTWDQYATTGDVPAAVVNVFAEGGSVDANDIDTFIFHETQFEVTEPEDGEVEITIGTLSVSNLPAGVDRTLFTAHTTAGPSATTTPTDIMSQSIAGNTLNADGQALDVFIAGDDFNQSGIGITWEIAILLGGVEIYRDTTNARASSTTRRPWRLQFTMRRLSSTTLHLSGQFASSTSATAPGTGLGALTATATMDAPLSSAAASPTVAWGSSQTLQVRITASINNANTDFTRRQYSIKRTAA